MDSNSQKAIMVCATYIHLIGDGDAKYLCQDTSSNNPLKCWLEDGKQFSQLAKMARKYLFCVPAISMPSERAFSIVGQVVNAKRAYLLPDNVNMRVFLAEN